MQHEPSWRVLGQRGDVKLLLDVEDRALRVDCLPYKRTSQSRCVRLHRAVLQPVQKTLKVELPQPGSIRAAALQGLSKASGKLGEAQTASRGPGSDRPPARTPVTHTASDARPASGDRCPRPSSPLRSSRTGTPRPVRRPGYESLARRSLACTQSPGAHEVGYPRIAAAVARNADLCYGARAVRRSCLARCESATSAVLNVSRNAPSLVSCGARWYLGAPSRAHEATWKSCSSTTPSCAQSRAPTCCLGCAIAGSCQ